MTAEEKSLLEWFLALAAGAFALGFWIRHKEGAARLWPKATGVIVTSQTVRQYAGRGRDQVSPVIEYEFNHEGRSFKTSHWRLGNFSVGNSASAEAVVCRYPVGSSVTVLVNTRQPMKSVLEHQPSWLSWVPFGFGIIFFLGLCILALSVFVMKLHR